MKYDFEIVFVCVFASVVGMVVFHNSVFCSVSTEFQVLLSLFTFLVEEVYPYSVSAIIHEEADVSEAFVD